MLESGIPGFGAGFKDALSRPGPWMMMLAGFGECLPNADNRMLLDEKAVDRFGIPQVKFEFEFSRNEQMILDDLSLIHI